MSSAELMERPRRHEDVAAWRLILVLKVVEVGKRQLLHHLLLKMELTVKIVQHGVKRGKWSLGLVVLK